MVRIGIDFDNTLIGYDGLFRRLAREKRWLGGRAARTKNEVKKGLIAEDGHDRRWQRLQAEAYGSRILEAPPFPGALKFVAKSQHAGHKIFIVSHKSERSHLDPSVRLRTWAKRWLKTRGAALSKSRVFFASTRDEKVRMIARLGLDVFIDDLPEVLEHPRFPSGTGRILFRPASGWRRVSQRIDMISAIGPAAATTMEQELGSPCARAAAVPSRGNNRLLRVGLENGTSVLVKRYLVDARDKRPRARTEFESLRLLWENGLRDIPRPIALDPARTFAIFSWLPGQPMKGLRLSDEHTSQAAAFLRKLIRLSHRPGLQWTAEAADSRSRLSDYAAHILRRLKKVRAGARAIGDNEAIRLVEDSVAPAARAVIARLKHCAADAGVAYDAPQPARERILSPSDFGFHNAVLSPDGRARFLDFEYFGWDDPAKLVADLFHHAGQKRLSERQQALFLNQLCRGWKGAPSFRRRLALVMEPIAMEWVLIILNVLSPETLERRRFAAPSLNRRKLVAERLRAARKRLQRISLC